MSIVFQTVGCRTLQCANETEKRLDMVRIKFIGGARTVTGSCFIVEGPSGNVMVDCGMFQGPRELEALNREPRGYKAVEIERVILTHAHIDHSGLLPRLCRRGFKGSIFAHFATVDLAGIMLPDSGHIQEQEAEWTNRKRIRQGRKIVKPLYTKEEAASCLEQFNAIPYDSWTDIGGGFRARLRDAGHILGSAIVELEVQDKGEWRRIVFSGDLGNVHPPILREPSVVEGGEVVLCETTYGGRLHEPTDVKKQILRDIITRAYDDKGKVIIPSFAIGRTQEIIYILNELLREDAIPEIPVYIDSPLAISATEIFKRHPECYDDETLALIESGIPALDFPGLKLTRHANESRAINDRPGPEIIVSASGMCEAGRIKHHLKHNLFKPEAHIVFAGFQAMGTLGRRIRDGAKEVKILGERVKVKAKIHSIGAFSAHADRDGLASWLDAMKIRPGLVCLVHGEDSQSMKFAEHVREHLGLKTFIPDRGDEIDLDELPEETRKLAALPEETTGLIDEMAVIDEETSNLSDHLNRIRDLLEARLIEIDKPTEEKLRGICRSLGENAVSLLEVLDAMNIEGDE